MRAALHGLAWPWLLLAGALTAISMGCRAWRLSAVLGKGLSFPGTWRCVSLGYFASLFLPLGGGELVKAAALRHRFGLPLTRVGTALAVDRMFDIALLLALLGAVAGHGWTGRPGTVPLALGIAGLLALAGFLAISGRALRGRLRQWAAGKPRRRIWLDRFEEIHDQAAALRNVSLLPRLGLLQAAIFFVDVLSAWCCLLAFPAGAGLPFAAPLRVALFVMLAFALPLLPGGLGSHQAAVILALTPFGFGPAEALSVSLVGEVVHVATLTTLGTLALARPPREPAAPK